jgi:mRNA interferase MazF
VQRGDVWWGELPPPVGRRPLLLLSRDSAYRIRTSVTVAVITRTIRNIPVEVPLTEQDGMPVRCAVNLDNIITIPKSMLTERITKLSAGKLVDVTKAITFALDLRP